MTQGFGRLRGAHRPGLTRTWMGNPQGGPAELGMFSPRRDKNLGAEREVGLHGS